MYKYIFKRGFDCIVVLGVLFVIWPLLLVITIGLHFANKKSGAFFLQERPGRNAKIFKVFKFKTMTDDRDSEGNLLPDEKRLTRVGKFVRSTSLDELPQLFNVLKGDMSLIGPRPLLVRYLTLYDQEQARRHEVRPGITGWAQVNGRNAISWQQKFEYDVWYVDHLTFGLDMKILFLTIKKVFVREGITSRTSSTMELFTGNN
ncbi:MAG: sugar transferase [Bacteroidales bacterium]|nr:sugar transferase [Bacteroidales bacterium]